MALFERIVNLIEEGGQRPVVAVTKIHAQRVEAIAEYPRHAEQADRAAFKIDAGGLQMPLDLRAQRPARAVAVVGVVKAHGVEAVMREQMQAPRQAIDLVEIEQHPEHAIAQPMRPRPQTAMHDHARIKRGAKDHAASSGCGGIAGGGPSAIRPDSFSTCQGRRPPPSVSATARPACKPSS